MTYVGPVYLQSRLASLLRSQNADGGWGYFPGRTSWTEPTAYAVLALNGLPGAEQAVERGWACLASWQTAEGGWRPGVQVQEPTWVTSLGLIVGSIHGLPVPRRDRAIAWLLNLEGRESRLAVRLASRFHLLKTDVNVAHLGWPWWPGNSAWIEPTAMAILALRKAAGANPAAGVSDRVRDGEELILSRRGRDGGWNSGNPRVLKVDVPSYPETTGIALIGLQGRDRNHLASPLESAHVFYRETKSSLARAWIAIALQCFDKPLPPPPDSAPPADILLCALQALAHPEGNHHLLRPEVAA